jgi:hypothetical protein
VRFQLRRVALGVGAAIVLRGQALEKQRVVPGALGAIPASASVVR